MRHPSPSNPHRTRRAVRWLIAWLVITALGFTIHWLQWLNPQRGSESSLGEHVALKVVSNIQQTVTMPAWAVMNVLRYKWGVDSPWWSFLTLALAWGAIAYLLSGLERTRRRLAGGDRDVGAASASREQISIAPHVNLARRRLLFDAAIGGTALAAGASIVKGVIIEPWDLVVRRYTVPVRDLPRTLEGYRILQVSDTHLGPRIPASFVRTVVEESLKLKPDLIALTGDYIHMGARYIDMAAQVFAPLTQGPRAVPVVGTLGNHDWWGDGPGMSLALTRIGVDMIDNARVYVRASDRAVLRDAPLVGEALCIAGFGDLREDMIDPWGTLGSVHQDVPRLVLAHNPDSAEEMEFAHRAPPRIDLMLSGHTHGGQVRLPIIGTPGGWVPSRYGAKYAGGLVQGPHCRVLISRGVGMSIFPVRFGVPPELVEITLKRE